MGGFPYDKYQGYAFWFHLRCVQDYACYRINLPLTYYRISQQNASNSGALHETWIYYEYYLIRNLLTRYFVPGFIYEPYLLSHAHQQYNGLQAAWKSKVKFPIVEKKTYPAWRVKLSRKCLRLYAKLFRYCQF